jgi:REP element-mobilizing transposase RayT
MTFCRRRPKNAPLDPEFYETAGQAVFLTIRCSGERSPFVISALNTDIVGALLRERRRSRCALYACCLMPNHLHILVAPCRDGASVLDMLRRYKGASTRIAWRYGITGRLWQPRYYDRVVRHGEAVEQVADYIMYNPVRRGLAAEPDQYRWSDLVDPVPWD